jgi:DegV family protein with EDD domain
VETFEQVYAELSAETDEIISIHVSSKLSPTVQNAREAAGRFLGRSRISILDSELISGGLGLLVVAAAEAAANGSNMQQIVRLLRGMIPHIYVVFFIESLEYLERSQRIDRSQAILGNLLNIKPMLIIEDGELMPLEKVRTRDKAVERLHQFISEFAEFDKITISHGLNGQESPDLLERIAETFPDREISITTYGPSMTAQLGPKAIGVIVCEGR